MDKKLAQRKHFPAVNWSISYTNYLKSLEAYYEKVDEEFLRLRDVAKNLLQSEEDLIEIVQLVGKDSLAETDKVTLEASKMIREDFLQQNSYTPWDKYCPFYKTVWMLKNIVHWFNLAKKCVQNDTTKSLEMIKKNMSDLMYKLAGQKFQDIEKGETALVKFFQELNEEISTAFANLDTEA